MERQRTQADQPRPVVTPPVQTEQVKQVKKARLTGGQTEPKKTKKGPSTDIVKEISGQ
jgi:hypothetical protein